MIKKTDDYDMVLEIIGIYSDDSTGYIAIFEGSRRRGRPKKSWSDNRDPFGHTVAMYVCLFEILCAQN